MLGGVEQQDKRLWAETDTQQVPPEHKEELPYCAAIAPEQIVQRNCGVSLIGGIFKNCLDKYGQVLYPA